LKLAAPSADLERQFVAAMYQITHRSRQAGISAIAMKKLAGALRRVNLFPLA
jgi:hypothetical protein